MFQDARYVSASEAIWRILGFDIVNHKPSVVRLEVHTENHHTVYFRQGEERAAALRDSTTKLEAWLKLTKCTQLHDIYDTMSIRGTLRG